jgi:hypothetical protein
MSDDGRSPDDSESSSGSELQPQRRRPRWATILAVLMLLVGARLFLGSLTDFRQLMTGQSMADLPLEGLTDVNREMLIRGQIALDEALSRLHPTAAAIQAVGRFVLALVMLFAVAAVYSDDRRARLAGVLAGWAGTIFYLGTGAFVLLVARHGVGQVLPDLQKVAAKAYGRAGDPVPPMEGLAQLATTLMVQVPLMAAGFGLLFSMILVSTFGGQRGRSFYV